MSAAIPGVLATREARAAVELSAEELAAIQADVESAPADEESSEPASDEGAPAVAEAAGGEEPEPVAKAPKPAAAAPAKAPSKAAPRTLTAENTPDEVALAQAAVIWPGREFADGEAARASLNGVLQGNAGRAKRLADLEAENEAFRQAEETRKARTAAEAPPETGSGKGATAPDTKAPAADPSEAEAQEFLTGLGPQGWAYYDRLFDGEGLPDGVDATAGRRYALAGLFREFAKFERGKRLALETALDAKIDAALEAKVEPRLKKAEEPAVKQQELLDSAKAFYEFYNRNMDDVTGETRFPEFEDKQAISEISLIWGNELKAKRTDEAIELAVLRFRSRNPDWAPAAEDEDAEDDGSPSTSAEADTAGAGRKARGAISGTSVPGAGLPARKQPAPGEMKDDPAAEVAGQRRKNWGFTPAA